MRIFKKQNEFSQIYDSVDALTKRVGRLETKIRHLRFRQTKWEDLKVGIFVDVQNMFYAARRKSEEARLDYVKLSQFILRGRRPIKAAAYMIENPEIDQSGFISLLAHHAFEVRKKPLIQRADGSQKGDWDMGMAIDILDLVDALNVVALVSGDGDFVSLVNTVKTRGPTVEVYGFPENTAIDLKEVADKYFPLGDSLLYKP